MSTPGSLAELMMGASQSTGYQISRSLRGRSANSNGLSWTPGTAATSAAAATLSIWVKRAALGSVQSIFCTSPDAGAHTTEINFQANDTLYCQIGTSAASRFIQTSQAFRDVGAWMHIVLAYDRAQGTAANRLRLYVNGPEITAFSTDQRSSITSSDVSGWNAQSILQCYYRSFGGASYSDFYACEIYNIDGQQLTSSSFGETDATTGAWVPKTYAGTYGNNGGYWKLSDNSSQANLGTDSSGGGHTLTVANFSVTTGINNDSVYDTPTNYGTSPAMRGNYCTLDYNSRTASGTISMGNLQYVGSAGNDEISGTMLLPKSGKWFIMFQRSAGASATYPGIGFCGNSSAQYFLTGGGASGGSSPGSFTEGFAFYWNGDKRVAAVTTGSAWTPPANGSWACIAVDFGALKAWVGTISGTTITWAGGGDPAAGTTPTATLSASSADQMGYVFAFTTNTGGTINVDFGQQGFSGVTPPTGFNPMCYQAHPDPAIINPANYVKATAWSPNAGVQTISSLAFQPDLNIHKRVDTANVWYWVDSQRGTSKLLDTSTANAETTDANFQTSFNSNGWSMGSNNYAGGTAVTVSFKASDTAGFSIIPYAGSAGAQNVNHNLSAAPDFIPVKNRSFGPSNWNSYHELNGGGSGMSLNTTAAQAAINIGAPTSTQIVLSAGGDVNVNNSGQNFIAYCWRRIFGFSAFGPIYGNGVGSTTSINSPMFYTGFLPEVVLVKIKGVSGDWNWITFTRPGYNDASYSNAMNFLNTSGAEVTTATSEGQMDFYSNGFKFRSNNASFNTFSHTDWVIAFAHTPAKYARAR